MTKQQKLIAGIGTLIFVVALAVSWFVRAPYTTLQSIKDAAEQRNVPELNRLIDFPSVKSSLKLMMMDSINQNAGDVGGLGAGMARLFAGAFVGPIIEAMVTPESIAIMFSGKLPRKPGDAPTPSSPTAPSADEQPATAKQEVTVTRNWEGLSAVRVNVRANTTRDNGLTFVMRRDGLSWRLTAIER